MNDTRETSKWEDAARDIFQQGPCFWCGTERAGEWDHLTPRSRGGTDDHSNLVKGAKTEDEYRAWLASRGST